MLAPVFLFSPCSTNSVTSLLIFFFFLKCTQTHPYTNTSTQTNQYRDTLAQKKKKTQRNTNTSTQTNQYRDTLAQKKKKTQRNTNTPIHKQTQTNKQQRDRSMLIGTIDAWSGTIGACGSCLIGARGYRSCLIRMIGAWLEQSKLVGLAWSKLMGLAWLELVSMGLALSEPN